MPTACCFGGRNKVFSDNIHQNARPPISSCPSPFIFHFVFQTCFGQDMSSAMHFNITSNRFKQLRLVAMSYLLSNKVCVELGFSNTEEKRH
jgi:hypothetical protein